MFPNQRVLPLLFSSDIEIKVGQKYTVRVTDQRPRDDVLRFCRISADEIVMAECPNGKLKKLDNRYKVIESISLYIWLFDICSIGNGKCVAASRGRKLQFVNVKGKIELAYTIDINHDCNGLTFYEGHLYIADTKSVYLHRLDGIMLRTVYTHNSPNTLFQQITISSDGNKMYITNNFGCLLIIDLERQDASPIIFRHAACVALDNEGNILLCAYKSNNIFKLSADGKRKLGKMTVKNDEGGIVNNTALYFDRQNKCLLTSGSQGCITALKV